MWRRHAPLTGVYGNSNCIFHPATRPCKPASGRKNFKAVMRDRRCPFHNSINSMPNARVAFLAHLSLVSPRFVGLELLAWGCLETRPKAYSVSEPSFRVRKCNSWQASKVTTWKDTAWDECDTIEIRLYVRVTCVGLASVGGQKFPIISRIICTQTGTLTMVYRSWSMIVVRKAIVASCHPYICNVLSQSMQKAPVRPNNAFSQQALEDGSRLRNGNTWVEFIRMSGKGGRGTEILSHVSQ